MYHCSTIMTRIKLPPKNTPKKNRKTRTPARFKDFEVSKPSGSRKKLSADNRFFGKSKKSITASELREIGIKNFDINNYIPSRWDKPKLIQVRYVSLIDGQGLFAREDIPEGTCIGVYTGKISSVSDFKHSKADTSYAMQVGGSIVDAIEKGNFTRYINFSDTQANVEFVEENTPTGLVVKVVTTEAIAADTQILIDYNTYDDQHEGHFVFLNPTDQYTPQEVYSKNKKTYQTIELSIDFKVFDITAEDSLAVTPLGFCILEGQSLTEIDDDEFNPEQLHLPYFKLDEKKKAVESYSLLLFACYLGQTDNVKWLIEHGANINQQHNTTGNCALFAALDGYVETEEKEIFVEILKYLIKNNANLSSYDTSNRTFLHKAIHTLTDEHFILIIDLLKNQEGFFHLYDFLDKDSNDIVLTCIKTKNFVKLEELLIAFPAYFQEGFRKLQKSHKVSFINTLDGLQNNEKEQFVSLLDRTEVTTHTEIKKWLDKYHSEQNHDDDSDYSSYRFS